MPVENSSSSSIYNPRQGYFEIVNDWSPIDVWHILHENARKWIFSDLITKEEYDGTDSGIIRSLSNFPAARWHSLCTAAGMTVYGAVVLSWCEGVELNQVWEGWEASGFPLKTLPEFERPAHLINPALLPVTNSLKEIINIAENKSLPICAMMVAKRDSLEIDLPDSMLKSASPQIASFLKAHIEGKPDRTVGENTLIEA